MAFIGGTYGWKAQATRCRARNEAGKYGDGGALYLIVNGPAAKSWSYRDWKDGKERWHGLGSFKDVSLKNARLERDAAACG
ncbi:hypothetical protein ACVIGA_008622 [Bradyrhizobium sp. USDA 3240]